MRARVTLGAALLAAASLAACQSNVSPDTYAAGSVGQVNRAAPGVVVSARPVRIGGTQSGAGAVVGTLGGAAIGASLARSARGSAIGALSGAAIGLAVGAIAEEIATQQPGMEYIVRLESGHLVTVVQGAEPILSVNQKVILVYGTRSRVIPAPD
jgi:outer membrane lipoprotein SlyB